MKIVTIIGARPQIVKAAALSRTILAIGKQQNGAAIKEIIVHTGQHYDENMSRVFFDELGVPEPDYYLGIGSGSHGEQTGRMLREIEIVLEEEEPDYCLVYGDTNSTVAGAMAAAKLHIPVAHVEAGLRSFNRRMPEEINRVVTDHISELLFCPTETSVENLTKEGISTGVHNVGDVMFDCVRFYSGRAQAIKNITLKRLSIHQGSYYLATVHRAENTDDLSRLTNIVQALNEITNRDYPVVLPLHPRTAKCIKKHGLKFSDGIKVIPPVSYLEMIILESNARLILTDSGGVQKEAFWFSVPCVTLRDETEWIETVEAGWNILTGADIHRIVRGVEFGCRLQDHDMELMDSNVSPTRRICEIIQGEDTFKFESLQDKTLLREPICR
jgi:UDP-N-acetylglucosamine 2-epimerase